MKTRVKILLAVGTVMVLVTFFALPALLERIYHIEEWRSPWESYVWAANGNSKEDAEHPHVFFAGSVGKQIVERWIVSSGNVLVLRWSDGRLWWEDKAIVTDELAPYVSGLLRAKNYEAVLVVIPQESKWRDVVGVLDKMRMVKARVIGLCMEI